MGHAILDLGIVNMHLSFMILTTVCKSARISLQLQNAFVILSVSSGIGANHHLISGCSTKKFAWLKRRQS